MASRLIALARSASGREVVTAERLAGGSAKGVYRLWCDDGGMLIGYRWHAEESYWPADDEPYPFDHASGAALFGTAHGMLRGLGVRVPRLVALEPDAALVEDVRGGSLADRVDVPLTRLRAMIQTLHGHRADYYGRPTRPRHDRRAEDVVLARALDHLDQAAAAVDRVAAVRDALADTLLARRAAVRPRSAYRLIHGELGPDHVLLDDDDQPVLIDVEGLMFFDVEWEHAFLALRFGDRYAALRDADLDVDRLRFYRLAQYLSLVAGPSRLLAGGFPDRVGMLRIMTANIERVLGEA